VNEHPEYVLPSNSQLGLQMQSPVGCSGPSVAGEPGVVVGSVAGGSVAGAFVLLLLLSVSQ
jgi:hypothetical protein